MLREARGEGVKATVGNSIKPNYHFIPIVSGALNEELLETSHNKFEIYRD